MAQSNHARSRNVATEIEIECELHDVGIRTVAGRDSTGGQAEANEQLSIEVVAPGVSTPHVGITIHGNERVGSPAVDHDDSRMAAENPTRAEDQDVADGDGNTDGDSGSVPTGWLRFLVEHAAGELLRGILPRW